MDMPNRPTRSFRPGAVLAGLLLLTLGAGLLLERSAFEMHHFVAPLVLIVLGAVMTF